MRLEGSNIDDVLKTRLLFEKVMRGEPLLRGTGAALTLSIPEILR